MSRILEIKEKLHATIKEIALAEAQIAEFPDSNLIPVGLASLHKRQQKLERDFQLQARSSGKDVFYLRLISDDGNPVIQSVGRALTDWQTLVSTVFAAKSDGAPRHTTAVGIEVAATTGFEFAYSFSGSLGIAMTLSNEQDLFEGSTPLDKSIITALELTALTEKSQVAEYAKELGRGPLRAAYRFAEGLVKSGMHADMNWQREEMVRATRFARISELEILLAVFDQSGDTQVQEVNVTGILQAFDNKRQTFKIELLEGEMISGSVGESLVDCEWTVFHSYAATIRKSVQFHYASDQDKTSYTLLSLKPIG